MSSGQPQRAPEPGGDSRKGRSPLAHLLHALNQPLTGLQCSLELALAARRTPEQYAHTMRDGLQLTERMRILAEALRELADTEQETPEPHEKFLLEPLLREMVDELHPVAEDKDVQILLEADALIQVQAGRRTLGAILFRMLESGLSLAARSSALRVAATSDAKQVCLTVRWQAAAEVPEHSPFSRSELGLLLAGAAGARAGGECSEERSDTSHTVSIRLPLTSNLNLFPSNSTVG